jgi:hypothetical protein
MSPAMSTGASPGGGSPPTVATAAELATASAPQLAIGSIPPAAPQNAYPSLPEELHGASFDAQRCWDIVMVRAALEEYGFVVLRGFVPERIAQPALAEATEYFLGVLRAFKHGYAIDKGVAGIDEVARLPSCVWENVAKKKKTITFAKGSLGMTVHPQTLEVVGLTPNGQASRLGVRPGWAVEKASNGRRGLTKVRQPLVAWLEAEQPAVSFVTFQPPANYSPLAVSQKWGVFTSKGYQPDLGLGKCTDAENFATSAGVMNAQLWMRNYLASLHDCMPTELCWKPDGVSFKAGISFRNAPDSSKVCFGPWDPKSILLQYFETRG